MTVRPRLQVDMSADDVIKIRRHAAKRGFLSLKEYIVDLIKQDMEK